MAGLKSTKARRTQQITKKGRSSIKHIRLAIANALLWAGFI
jgi:hypothetical protein